MPKKTNEPKEEKKTTVAKKKTSVAKKSVEKKESKTSATKKKTKVTKKEPVTAKKTTTKKAAVKKEPAAKKTTTKKTVTKKEPVTAKKTTTKKAADKKTTTRKKVEPKKEVQEYYDLPYRYDQTIVKVLAQTPKALFVYWDISKSDVEKYKKQYGENFLEVTKPVLTVYNEDLHYSFEVEVDDFANGWYINVNDSRSKYTVKLGRKPISEFGKFDTNYIYLANSNEMIAPNDHILIEEFPEYIMFRNVKTNQEYSTNYFKFMKALTPIYNIYDMYKAMYKDENIDDLSNPSSGTFSSTFK